MNLKYVKPRLSLIEIVNDVITVSGNEYGVVLKNWGIQDDWGIKS